MRHALVLFSVYLLSVGFLFVCFLAVDLMSPVFKNDISIAQTAPNKFLGGGKNKSMEYLHIIIPVTLCSVSIKAVLSLYTVIYLFLSHFNRYNSYYFKVQHLHSSSRHKIKIT